MAMTAKERKRLQRARQKKLDSKIVEIEISQKRYEQLQKLCVDRAGIREPYAVKDYLTLLIEKLIPLDLEHYEQQAKSLGKCAGCNEVLPHGCGGVFNGQSDCFHTIEYRKLQR